MFTGLKLRLTDRQDRSSLFLDFSVLVLSIIFGVVGFLRPMTSCHGERNGKTEWLGLGNELKGTT